MKRLKIYKLGGVRPVGYLEQDEGSEAWHFVGPRRSRRWAALGVSFASVWGSISEFRESVNAPIEIGF